MNNNETLTIPTGTNREDIKERERIISDVYRRWYEANPTKAVFNKKRYENSVLHHGHWDIRKPSEL